MESTRPGSSVARVLTPLSMAVPSQEQDVVHALRRLIAVCHESETGLRAAARSAVLPCFRTMLTKYARQRSQLAAELGLELSRMDEEIDHSGPVATGARGAWTDVLVAGDEGSLLFACERAEETTRRAFDDTRRRGLPKNLDALVARQAELISEALDHLQRIRQH